MHVLVKEVSILEEGKELLLHLCLVLHFGKGSGFFVERLKALLDLVDQLLDFLGVHKAKCMLST